MVWVFYGAVLILLYLLSSTDLIIKEHKNEVYPISVVIDDAKDENYVNFRKGMDLAAVELNADVSFITLYEKNYASQQLEMMLREQQDGARALIVSPVEETIIEEALTQKRITIPLILVHGELPADRVSSVVTTDYYEMGQQLAETVIAEQNQELPVYLFSGNRENVATRRFRDGLSTTLSEAGFHVIRYMKNSEDTFRKIMEELGYPGTEDAVIIALDQESLSETASLLEDDPALQPSVKELYGRGTTLTILNQLDRGTITGLSVTDEFSAGYLSVKRAVEAATNQVPLDQTILPSYYIEKEDLRRPEYEKMLYPIE